MNDTRPTSGPPARRSAFQSLLIAFAFCCCWAWFVIGTKVLDPLRLPLVAYYGAEFLIPMLVAFVILNQSSLGIASRPRQRLAMLFLCSVGLMALAFFLLIAVILLRTPNRN